MLYFPNLIYVIQYEVSQKEISEYPFCLIEVFHKTNVYETSSVYFVMDLLQAILDTHILQYNTIYNLDYSLLHKAFVVIVSVDNCLNVSKMLWVYCTYGHVMPNYHLIDMVLGVFKLKFLRSCLKRCLMRK